jgi:hypothetical protein
MELTINIKNQKNIKALLNFIRKFDDVEIINVKEGGTELPVEHKILLDERLKKIEEGITSFKDWDSVKRKYENRTI